MTDERGAANQFAGDSSSVVQATSIYGGIHYSSANNARFPPPRQLPGAMAGFVDRESSMRQLNELLTRTTGDESADETASALSIITGPPGVGKTALALHWAHRIRAHFPDGDLYVDMGGYSSGSSLSLEQALDYFLRSLNVDPERIPMNIDERVVLYRSLLGGKRVLIVIDNVSSVRQVRNLLPGSHGCLVVVTSRSSLAGLVAREGATRVTLDVLPPEDALDLLAEIIGDERVESAPDAAARISALCGYLPIALRVVAERIAGRPHLALAEAVSELESEQDRLDTLRSNEDELTDVRAVFSWSYHALGPDHRKIFRLLGSHAGPEFSCAAVAALADVSPPVVGQHLRRLADAHLVQEISTDRYRSHDLLRAYSIECAVREDSQRERTHAVRRMMNWYLLTADAARKVLLPYSRAVPVAPYDRAPVPEIPDVTAAMAWFDRERLNLLTVLQQAMDLGQYDIAWKLPVVAEGYFELRSYWFEWESTRMEGLNAARIVGDAAGEAAGLLGLGDARWRLGRLDEALDCYETAAAIASTINDRWLEGFALRGQGLIHQERDDFDSSLPYFTRSLEVFRHSGNRRGEGMALLSIGKSHRGLGRFPEAIEHGVRSVSAFRDIGDEWSVAWGLTHLADARIDAGRFAQAQTGLTEALAIFERFADVRSTALAHRAMGEAFHRRGDHGRARTHWSAALALYEQLADPRAAELRERVSSLDEAGDR